MVLIIMGSDSAGSFVKPSGDVLRDLGAWCRAHVVSTRRTPARMRNILDDPNIRGYSAADDGDARRLGGTAAYAVNPVIGGPLARTVEAWAAHD